MDEGSKSKQEEGDIKEKLVHSTLNKDLVSRNEKVQVQVKSVHIFILICFAFQPGSQALRQRYKDVKMRNLENAAKLRRLKFFSAYVVPAILSGIRYQVTCGKVLFTILIPAFVLVYFGIGILHAETV